MARAPAWDGLIKAAEKMILVTGAGGFVGTSLVCELARRRIPHRGVTRRGKNPFVIPNIDGQTDWTAALEGVDVIVHLASRAHSDGTAPLDEVQAQRNDVDAALNLARQAARSGVKRFVFISSIKVNGEATTAGQPFTAADRPDPQNSYAQAKLDSELGLFALSRDTGLEVTVIRPPLVYGPGVKANFGTMMQWIDRGIPMPLGAVNNKRSFVYVGNLVDLIIVAAEHSGAAGEVFTVSDGEDMSTTELYRRLARALGRQCWVMPVPTSLLKLGATMLGRRDVANRLIDSLQVDCSKTREILGWVPRIDVDDGLQRTARSFQQAELALDPIARSA
ncbi:NAD-dependent epimerase/dehydratase family protein [Bradyrhizobium sp.]|uniref:NAD-dependent epimerase/dehydratase family protein n=1 Tax=Bradyrhizobium sp. TaxID=376 RepID=UPI0040379361